ncbi:MAG: sigma 54-interacting transcriptional regulator [Firmicutes bacterium]|jgi:transcriptional regulator with PAS, ATPase and Fis domain|nr:sigma 54-interacting transcriptional regulator [Bacillota bacterium]
MAPSIGMVLPSPELTALAREVAAESGRDIAIVEGTLEGGVEAARKLEAAGVQVIISRAPTGAMIRRACGVPVILIEVTPFDVVTALHCASQLSDRIGFVGFHKTESRYDFEFMERLLNITVIPMFYRDEAGIGALLDRASEKGVKVVVGTGACVMEAARARNIAGIPIRSSREAVREALERAEELLRIRVLDEEKTQRLKAVVDFSSDGILLVSEQGRVTVINPFAARFLGMDLEGASAPGLAESHRDNPAVAKLIGDGSPVTGLLVEVLGATLVVNRVPIRAGGADKGYVVTFTNAKKIQRLERRIRTETCSKGLVARFTLKDILGNSPAIVECRERIIQYAPTDSTVLILGETGSGKELAAQSIHNASARRSGPFVAVNCAALPETLLESELFGYAEGAFTGARKGGKPGLFELAHGGSIFLDEIGEVSRRLQARLLRVIQEREVMRIGDDRVLPVDVRIIAATNHDLRRDVETGKFRRDLFFRLDVLSLTIPPLRARAGDVLILANEFLARFGARLKKDLEPFGAEDGALLQSYSWPGNVRELENLVERYATLASAGRDSELVRRLMAARCGDEVRAGSGPDKVTIRTSSLDEMRKEILRLVLDQVGGNCAEAARRLGISRTTAWRWLKEIGTAPGSRRALPPN